MSWVTGMYKRLSLQIVSHLLEKLKAIAIERKMSINALISEMAWDFVEKWNEKFR